MDAFSCLVDFVRQIFDSARARRVPATLLSALEKLLQPLAANQKTSDVAAAAALVDAALTECRALLDAFEQRTWFGKLVKRRTQKGVSGQSVFVLRLCSLTHARSLSRARRNRKKRCSLTASSICTSCSLRCSCSA